MRSVHPNDLMDSSTMDDERRPELRKYKTMKTIEELIATGTSAPNQTPDEASGSRIRQSPGDANAKRLQLLRDYEMAASILRSRNRGDCARRKPHISFDQQRISMETTFRTAPGGRARVVLDEDTESPDAIVRRSLRAASEAYMRHSESPVPASSSENENSSSSRDDDSGNSTTKKKKKTVSFQDESVGIDTGLGASVSAAVATMSSSSRRHLMDQARCNDDENGPGNGHTSSPIHAACCKGDHVVVTHLLSFYHNHDAAQLVNSVCSCGMTPLQVACDHGHAKVAKLLLRRHASPLVHKRSHHAVSNASHTYTSAALLGVAKRRHRSCIALATARRHTETIELLLDHGASVDEDALITASSLGDAAIVRVLLQTQKKSGVASGLEKLWSGSSVSSSASTGSGHAAGEIDPAWISNAAVVAVTNEHPGLLPVLLGDGHSAISKARIVHCAIEATLLADYKLLRCLTKLFAHALLIDATDAHHNTLLHLAVKQASSRCVTLLIRLGIDVNARDALGITPLYMACARGQSSIVKLLLRAGAACAPMGPNDESPLHIAAQENHGSCVTLLLTEGNAPVDGTTRDKCTALHLACQRGNTTVAKCLLDHGADVNARTVDDETPLLKASRMSNMETVKLLLSRDAELATSSTSSISTAGGDYTHTASTASSVFSTGSTVRSLDLDGETDCTASITHSRSTTSAGSASSRRRPPYSQALLERVAAHQLPRRAEETAADAALEASTSSISSSTITSSSVSGRSDQIFMAKSNSHKSFRGWLKSVVKHK